MIYNIHFLKICLVTVLLFVCISFFSYSSCNLYGEVNSDKNLRLNFASHIDANVYTERLVYEIFGNLGYEVSINLLENDKALEGVNYGVYDGISCQAEGHFSKYYNLEMIPVEITRENYIPVVEKSDNNRYTEWNDLDGKSVGILSGKETIKQYIPDSAKKIIEKPSVSLLYESLLKEECDVLILSDSSDKPVGSFVIPSQVKTAGYLGSKPCYIYINKQYSFLTDDVVKEIKRMQEDGTLDRLKAMKPIKERDEKCVLYLSSYSSEMIWEQKLLKGIGNILDNDSSITYHNIALNSYRKADITFSEDQAMSTISSDFIHTPPDAVIVSDNEAVRFLFNNYNYILPNDIPIVFCGLNEKTLISPKIINQYTHMGGVFESISALDTVDEIMRLFPSTESIYVINDYSLTGTRWQSDIKNQLRDYNDKVEIKYNENISFEELESQVSKLGKGSVVLCGSYFLDANSNYYPQEKIQKILSKASSVPIFGLLDSSQGKGQLGGKYADAEFYGETAAEMLIGALDDDNPGKMEVKDLEEKNRWIFDIDKMQKYGIKKADLPLGSTILNSKPSLYESNPTVFYIILAGAAVFIVIIALLSIFTYILNKRNKQLVTAEEGIRESRDDISKVKNHLQTIIETAPIAYSMLVDDEVVECNRFYRENVGLTDGEKNIAKYKNSARYMSFMDECRDKGFVEDIFWQIEKDGEPGPRYLYNIALSEHDGKDAIVMWGVEIEELEKQKDAIARAYEDLQQVIESTPLPIVIVYPVEKEFLYANSSWEALFEIPEGVNVTDLKMGTFATQNIDDLIERAYSEDKIVTDEVTYETFNGEQFIAQTYFKKVIYDGRECLVIAHKDLSEEKAREKMLRSAADKEREASRLKSHFLMNMSHEIRTPMNSIIGMTQMVKADDDPGKLFTSIMQMGKSASVLLDIINDVLDMALIEDGEMVMNPEICKLSEIIDNVRVVIEVESEKKQLDVQIDTDGISHDLIIADASRLQQVLIALLSNAVKFTPEEGRISLTVNELENNSDTLIYSFEVKDSGIGIEPDKMNRLFKSFQQGDDSITREYGGLGLGLTISKEIVGLMNGDIWVDSNVGVGSTFTFTIQTPYLCNSNDDGTEVAEINDESEIDFSKLRILIVDDVDINRMIIEELLQEIGINTDEAENGRQALDKVSASEIGYYDMIFMDIQMPVMDGCTATKEIRMLGRADTDDIPIIAVTANVLPDDINMILDCSMQDYLSKPVFKDQIIEIIKKYI